MPESSREGSVPGKYTIRGFWGTTLRLAEAETTAEILQDILGFEKKTGKMECSTIKLMRLSEGRS